MRRLPLATATVDAVLFAASLHYAPLDETIPEAARVLDTDGLLIAIDSPVYPDEPSRRRAATRSAAYYRERGYPDLASHYHPIEAGALRKALTLAGLGIERFDVTRRRIGCWGGGSPACFVIARRLT
jgi:SAM-dependent methyltransferase